MTLRPFLPRSVSTEKKEKRKESLILDEIKWSRVEKYKKLDATSESKRLNSMSYYEIELTKIT
jgi:hypothetical protein